jgi:hypothetical protein
MVLFTLSRVAGHGISNRAVNSKKERASSRIYIQQTIDKLMLSSIYFVRCRAENFVDASAGKHKKSSRKIIKSILFIRSACCRL